MSVQTALHPDDKVLFHCGDSWPEQMNLADIHGSSGLYQVNKEIADFGCKVIAQYAVLGQCDFVTVIEAADNETVAHLSVDLGSRGTVNIVSLPAIPISDLRAKLKGPKQMGRS
jgi:uncharacterized protein with GYD domain